MKVLEHLNPQNFHKPVKVKTKEEVSNKQNTLPEGFYWNQIDVKVSGDLSELYVLLRDNYVEDDSGTLRFDYSKEFLLWALNPPNAKVEWTLGIRDSASNELVGFGSGVPITMNSHGVDVPFAMINFLCLKKNIRKHKGLTPLILAEGIRRAEISDVLQLVYTSGRILPTPFASPMYWYRDLNPEKTLHIGYSAKPIHLSLEEYYTINHVPEDITMDLRPMTQEDVPQVTKLLNKHMRELYEFSVIFNE